MPKSINIDQLKVIYQFPVSMNAGIIIVNNELLYHNTPYRLTCQARRKAQGIVPENELPNRQIYVKLFTFFGIS